MAPIINSHPKETPHSLSPRNHPYPWLSGLPLWKSYHYLIIRSSVEKKGNGNYPYLAALSLIKYSTNSHRYYSKSKLYPQLSFGISSTWSNTKEFNHLGVVSLYKLSLVEEISIQLDPREKSSGNRHFSCNDPFQAVTAAPYRERRHRRHVSPWGAKALRYNRSLIAVPQVLPIKINTNIARSQV